MPVTYKKIASVTVTGATTADMDFQNIPTTYDDLLLKVSVRCNRASANFDDFLVKFNNSSANFSTRYLTGNGSTAASSTTSTGYIGDVNASSSTSSTRKQRNSGLFDFDSWSLVKYCRN